jgi:IS30 family transposase
MLPVNRIGNGTLFSLRVQVAAVTTKMSDKNQMEDESKIMNTTIVSAEAKARLTEAVKNYTPPAPEKYRALNEVKDSIIALRERKASYETIRAMLHENAGIEVSHQTVARYCREMLDSAKAKKPRRSKTPAAEQPASAQTEPQSRPPIGYPRPRGPRIADSKNL